MFISYERLRLRFKKTSLKSEKIYFLSVFDTPKKRGATMQKPDCHWFDGIGPISPYNPIKVA